MNIEALVTRKELNPKGYPLTPIQECNFTHLYMAVNVLRYECGIPFIITSGFRSKEDQLKINPKHMNSAHLQAAACDVYDKDRKIWDWLMAHLDNVIDVGVYLESKNFTPTWVHMQIIPPKSGNRIFLP